MAFDKLYDDLAESLDSKKIEKLFSDIPEQARQKNMKYIQYIFECLNPIKKKEKILDIGCGFGYIMWLLEIENYTGLDISEKVLKIARKLFKKPKFVQGTVERMPFRKENFDIIIFTEVIEHLPNPKKAISEIYRVMRSGGTLFITTPNKFRWLHFPVARIIPWSLKIKLIKLKRGREYSKQYEKQKQIEKKHGIDQHQKLYSSRSLSKVLKRAGFEIIDAKTFGSTANQFNHVIGSMFEKIPCGRDSLLIIAKKP